MGMSNYLPSSRISQSGVCTSSTRPAGPFEGQVIYETDTDRVLVWNASAWVAPNSQTSNPPGLELITGVGCSAGGTASNGVVTIGSAVSSVTVTNAFSASYDNYLINVSGVLPSTSGNWFMFGFNPASTTGFFGNSYGINFLGSVVNANRNNSETLLITQTNQAAGSNGMSINVFSPFLATRTSIFNTSSQGPGWVIQGGEHNPAVSQTQFFISVSLGTMTGGTIRVYGYRN
jgi:hypothetical protein